MGSFLSVSIYRLQYSFRISSAKMLAVNLSSIGVLCRLFGPPSIPLCELGRRLSNLFGNSLQRLRQRLSNHCGVVCRATGVVATTIVPLSMDRKRQRRSRIRNR